MKKRILSILLAAIMVVSLLPVTALAAVNPVPEKYWGTCTMAVDYSFEGIVSVPCLGVSQRTAVNALGRQNGI